MERASAQNQALGPVATLVKKVPGGPFIVGAAILAAAKLTGAAGTGLTAQQICLAEKAKGHMGTDGEPLACVDWDFTQHVDLEVRQVRLINLDSAPLETCEQQRREVTKTLDKAGNAYTRLMTQHRECVAPSRVVAEVADIPGTIDMEDVNTTTTPTPAPAPPVDSEQDPGIGPAGN